MSDIRSSDSKSQEHDPTILLNVLSAIESNSSITQRKLSSELGIALGLTNAYLKRCVRKGLIKIRQVPMRRYAYYLTPQGFSEKARLTGEYLTGSLKFFRRARQNASEMFRGLHGRRLVRILLVGSGDLAEVAALSAMEAEVEVVGILDPRAGAGRCAGRPVFASMKALKAHLAQSGSEIDAVVITAMKDPDFYYRQASDVVSELDLSNSPFHLLAPGIATFRLEALPG